MARERGEGGNTGSGVTKCPVFYRKEEAKEEAKGPSFVDKKEEEAEVDRLLNTKYNLSIFNSD